MDPDLETFKFKLLLVVAVAFIVSIFLTWTEARYFFFSKTRDAVVAQKQPFSHRDRYGHESRTIDVTDHAQPPTAPEHDPPQIVYTNTSEADRPKTPCGPSSRRPPSSTSISTSV